MQGQRLLIAAVVIPLLFFYVMYLPPVFFMALVMVVALLAQHEFYAMCRLERVCGVAGLIAGVLLVILVYLGVEGESSVIAAALMLFSCVRLFSRRAPEGALRDMACTFAGFIYVPLLLSYLVRVREFGPQWVVLVGGCVWAADSAAYYVGRGFGKRKLYPSVSPNKTVAGAIGAFGGAVAVSLGLSQLTGTLQPEGAVLWGFVIGAASIVGDLVESMFKRDAGIKDSSTILAGHGGFLDKVDGFVFVSPLVYWMLVG